MTAKRSPLGLRYFAHQPGAPECALAGESLAHHLLKLELAQAARQAGWHADMEVAGPDRTWRADVLAIHPAGGRRIALEAQLAAITLEDVQERTRRMAVDQVPSLWVTDRESCPWLGRVPSIRVHAAGDGPLAVVDGVARFNSGSQRWAPVPCPLPQFTAWLLNERIVWHLRASLSWVWTAPAYQAVEAEAVEQARVEEERRAARARRAQQQRDHRRGEIAARNTASRAAAREEATAAEKAARATLNGPLRQARAADTPGVREAVAVVLAHTGLPVTAGYSMGDPRWAGGVPLVDDNGVPAAVYYPRLRLLTGQAFRLLAGLLLVFPTRASMTYFDQASGRPAAFRRRPRKPIDGWKTIHIEAAVRPAADVGQAPPQPVCCCASPTLAVTIPGEPRPVAAVPADQPSAAALLFTAECTGCGGRYDKPWRRAQPSSP
jgi:competence protein CoiA